jgi:heme A synthase
MVSFLGFVIVLGWYALYSFGAEGITFEKAVLGMLLGIALVIDGTVVSKGKEK